VTSVESVDKQMLYLFTHLKLDHEVETLGNLKIFYENNRSFY